VETQEITDTVVGVSTLALAVTTWMLARRTKQTVDEAAETRRLTLAMATEATRARLDASAPSVDVELGSVVWPPHMGAGGGPSGYYGSQIGAGIGGLAALHEHEYIALVVPLTVHNASDRTVHVRCNQRALFLQGVPVPEATGPFRVPPGTRMNLMVQRVKSVPAWGELWEDPSLAEADEPIQILIDDGRENGVTDMWNVHLHGTPVRPLPTWRLVSTTADARLKHELSPSSRTYFLSRERNEQLPAIQVSSPLPAPRRPWRDTIRGTAFGDQGGVDR
jgi:hypothetical protein